MIHRTIRYSAIFTSLATPFSALAQQGINLGAITPYSNGIIGLINTILVPLLLAIAFLYFVYGVFRYFFWGVDNEGDRATGRQVILWGIIGFAVVLSTWGLVNVVVETFKITTGGNAPGYPKL